MGRRAVRGTVTRTVDGGEATLLPDADLPDGWILLIDGTQQSHVDLADPSRLEFEYMRRIGHVIDLLPPGPIRVVHLGGGAMAIARYASATRPRTSNLVVENDGPLVDMVRAHLPWPRNFQIRVRVASARQALDAMRDDSADLVILDVFARAQTPGEVTTTEAFEQARRVLGPDGTLVANIADGSPLGYARRYVAGVLETFDRVAVVVEPAVVRGRRFGNLVVAAQPRSAIPLDLEALERRSAGDPWPARVLLGETLDAFVGSSRPFADSTATGSPAPPPGLFGRL